MEMLQPFLDPFWRPTKGLIPLFGNGLLLQFLVIMVGNKDFSRSWELEWLLGDMKFMKLGSRPDSFQNDGDNIRYVASELATDVIITVGNVQFHLHKFPLLSKSSLLQKLVAATSKGTNDPIQIHDIPGGPTAFEICAKFCYGIAVSLSAYNVVSVHCAASYLEMYESTEKGNLIFKIEIFLHSSLFHGWKDSIIVLQSTKPYLPWSDKSKIISHCLDSIASKACLDTSKVVWAYTYNREKSGNDLYRNSAFSLRAVPRDWWVEDLCELEIDLYERFITAVKSSGRVVGHVIGEALKVYALRWLPGFSKGIIVHGGDAVKNRCLVETIVSLLPIEKGSVCCSFLLKLLKVADLLECDELRKAELRRRIGQQLGEASVTDLLMMFDVAMVRVLVGEFVMQGQDNPGDGLDGSWVSVAKLVDGYLVEIGRDQNLPLSTFVDLAEMVSSFPRSSHDGLYCAIDAFLKEHPGLNKSERKRMCRLMNCEKLSQDARVHAVQNERLPSRVVVQALFLHQAMNLNPARIDMPDVHSSVRSLLTATSNRSSRSVMTNVEEEWETAGVPEGGGGFGGGDRRCKVSVEKVGEGRMKIWAMARIFSKLWRRNEKDGEEMKSTTSSRKLSLS